MNPNAVITIGTIVAKLFLSIDDPSISHGVVLHGLDEEFCSFLPLPHLFELEKIRWPLAFFCTMMDRVVMDVPAQVYASYLDHIDKNVMVRGSFPWRFVCLEGMLS
jgi:hypothetical protein